MTFFKGTIVDNRYEIVQPIGDGRTGHVYMVRDVGTGHMLALKFFQSIYFERPSSFDEFNQGMADAQEITHENIVRVHRLGRIMPDGAVFLLREHVPGEDMDQLLARTPRLNPHTASEIFSGLCDALSHGHERKIFHRHMTPHRILLEDQENGRKKAKLLGLGMPYLATPPQYRGREDANAVLLDTVYMSPEQCVGGHIDERSAIYSLGCLLYHALAGAPPLKGDSALIVARMHMQERPEPISEVVPHAIPNALAQTVMRCLEKHPKDRFQHSVELKEALIDALIVAH